MLLNSCKIKNRSLEPISSHTGDYLNHCFFLNVQPHHPSYLSQSLSLIITQPQDFNHHARHIVRVTSSTLNHQQTSTSFDMATNRDIWKKLVYLQLTSRSQWIWTTSTCCSKYWERVEISNGCVSWPLTYLHCNYCSQVPLHSFTRRRRKTLPWSTSFTEQSLNFPFSTVYWFKISCGFFLSSNSPHTPHT